MDAQGWHEGNNRYLAASLRSLRLRLARLAQLDQSLNAPGAPNTIVEQASQASPAAPAQPTLLHRLFGGAPASAAEATTRHRTPLLTDGHDLSLEAQIAQAEEERSRIAGQLQPPPAPVMLAQQLGLSPFELEVVLLCAAMELDTRIEALCARAQGDSHRAYPTFALALSLFDQPSWDALSPDRPLRYWRLIDINQPGATPLTTSPLRADERIVSYFKGLNTLDDRLALLLTPAQGRAGPALLSPTQQSAVEAVLWHWTRAAEAGSSPVAQLVGTDVDSKLAVAQRAAAELRRHLYRVNLDGLPAQASEAELATRLWQRESLLLPLALFVDAQPDEGGSGGGETRALDRFVTRAAYSNGLIFLGVREALPKLGCESFVVDVDKPTRAEQRQAWEAVIQSTHPTADEAGARSTAERLSGQFNFSLGDIQRLAGEARTDRGEPMCDALWDACGTATRPKLDALAQRLDPRATWEDLVLPEENVRLLRLIALQVRQRSKVHEDWGFARRMNRGLGISALFAGESGTGKTMAAEVIANDLRLNLYRIDLSAVVSKYIGETEKNLRRLFDAAEAGGAILFFDEADALFGKRSEVKDSHDRYANIEINYLLQRMEAYGGLAILATNMKSALDGAFMRRLRFIVTFSFPGLAERKRMWQRAFPAQTPVGALDYDRLARLTLTGGNINSIALNAAFLAAQAGEPVTMPIVLMAARMEFRKLDKPVNESDFRMPEVKP